MAKKKNLGPKKKVQPSSKTKSAPKRKPAPQMSKKDQEWLRGRSEVIKIIAKNNKGTSTGTWLTSFAMEIDEKVGPKQKKKSKNSSNKPA